MKNIKYFIFLASLLFVTATVAFAQEQQNRKPVSEMTKEEMMELTYDDLLQLPFEDLIKVADKMGMSADELLDFFLNKDVTSASKRAEKSLNSPLSTTVISKEEIENSGVTSIPEALRLVPGMIVREKTNGNYDVHMRGNDNVPAKSMFLYSEESMSLVMIDGRPVYNYAFGGTFWETLPIGMADIERIEVIRGASSALYGPNAVNGAINIITKRVASNKVGVSGQVQAGNVNSYLANLSVTGGVDKFKFRVSGNYTRLDRFEKDFYVFDLNKKYSYDELESMKYWRPDRQGMYVMTDSALRPNMKDRFTDPDIATDKYGINAFLFYDLNKKVSFDLSFGIQQSDVISTTLGNHEIPMVGRASNTYYVDFKTKAYGFLLQVNHMQGDQAVEKSSLGWHIVPKITNTSLEYEQAFGTLVLRPGVSYQQAIYDDTKYINPDNREGFLNGSKKINAIAGFLRADYKAFEKLRLIAAIRADKYNYPDKAYFTYQFISSYDINANNVVRAVYSRANRGPFVVDTHADYDWVAIPENKGYTAQTLTWLGNKDLKLPVMDMYEIGYRCKPIKNIMVDLEAFYTSTKDYSYFLPDKMTLQTNFSTFATIGQPTVTKAIAHIQYYNFDMVVKQAGVTCNVSVVVTPKVNFKVFGTIQQTKIDNFYSKTIWDNFNEMTAIDTAKLAAEARVDGYNLYVIGQKIQGGVATAADLQQMQEILAKKPEYTATNPDIVNGKIDKNKTENVTNKSTPRFFGGGSVDYLPTKKLTLSTSFYFYSENTLLTNKVNDIGRYMPENVQNPTSYDASKYSSIYTVESKVIVNMKVAYKFYKESSVFVNARNLFNSSSREFAYVDKVNGLYLVGLNFNF